MGVQISAQLLLFVQSILLGLAAGAVYAVLRPMRRLWPALASPLDLLYAAGLWLACSAFLLRPADGVLRGYAVLGGLGGAALWFCGFDDAARPLWTFWAETTAWLASLALLPVRLTVRLLLFLRKTGNSLFYFAEKCCTIRFGYRRPHGSGPISGPAQRGGAGRRNESGTRGRAGRRNGGGMRGRAGRRNESGTHGEAGQRNGLARRNNQRQNRKRRR